MLAATGCGRLQWDLPWWQGDSFRRVVSTRSWTNFNFSPESPITVSGLANRMPRMPRSCACILCSASSSRNSGNSAGKALALKDQGQKKKKSDMINGWHLVYRGIVKLFSIFEYGPCVSYYLLAIFRLVNVIDTASSTIEALMMATFYLSTPFELRDGNKHAIT